MDSRMEFKECVKRSIVRDGAVFSALTVLHMSRKKLKEIENMLRRTYYCYEGYCKYQETVPGHLREALDELENFKTDIGEAIALLNAKASDWERFEGIARRTEETKNTE